jgi:hypothetical protein
VLVYLQFLYFYEVNKDKKIYFMVDLRTSFSVVDNVLCSSLQNLFMFITTKPICNNIVLNFDLFSVLYLVLNLLVQIRQNVLLKALSTMFRSFIMLL